MSTQPRLVVELEAAPGIPAPQAMPVMSRSQLFWRRFKRHKLGLAGGVVLLLFILMAIFAPVIAPQRPNYADFKHRKEPPSAEHWLGTDDLGRDVWSRLVYGGRVSLMVGFGAVALYMIIGTFLGTTSGYFGGKVDFIIMRITDIMMTFPSLLLILTFAAFTQPSIMNVILAIGLFEWPGVTRIIRSDVLSIRERDFITATKALGASSNRVLSVHVLPNIIGILVVTITYGVSTAIILETTMSFLGLGVPLPTPSWGNMISSATSITVMETMPWLWIPPGIAIAATVLALNFVGDGLRDAFDPRK